MPASFETVPAPAFLEDLVYPAVINLEVGLHASKFLEISAVENYLLTEYHIRS